MRSCHQGGLNAFNDKSPARSRLADTRRSQAVLIAMFVAAALWLPLASAQESAPQPRHGDRRQTHRALGHIERPVPTRRSQVNGMVLVPAGEFVMGCNTDLDTKCDDDESPRRRVYLDSFLIDRTEVTVMDYRRCVDEGECQPSGMTGTECTWSQPNKDNHPINCVSAVQATAFCSFVGKRLPTEAEWEKAARGADGRLYPWGNFTPGAASPRVANFADASYFKDNPSATWSLRSYDDGHVETAPVGSFPRGASPYGALDMAGNVWEWTADWYATDTYTDDTRRNPRGPSSGVEFTTRGGNAAAALNYMRASSRDSDHPETGGQHIGFRCARDTER